VFRSLQQRGASTAEKLVTTVGILVVLIGVATLVWTLRRAPIPPACSRTEPVRLGFLGENVVLGSDQLIIIGMSLVLTGLLVVLFAHTPIGMQIRAVVDRRELAELTSVDANKVSAISWALGCGLAGLAGVLLAPTTFGLDPVLLTLLVIETFSVAVVAKLASIPLAVLGGLALGDPQRLQRPLRLRARRRLPRLLPSTPSHVGAFLNPILPYLSVFLLFGALIVYRSLGEGADADEGKLRCTVEHLRVWRARHERVGV
jgi:branched-subunit amino acid ABC-type transport system permease component